MTLSQLATDGRTVRFRMFDALDAQGQKLSQINGSRTSTVRKWSVGKHSIRVNVPHFVVNPVGTNTGSAQ